MPRGIYLRKKSKRRRLVQEEEIPIHLTLQSPINPIPKEHNIGKDCVSFAIRKLELMKAQKEEEILEIVVAIKLLQEGE